MPDTRRVSIKSPGDIAAVACSIMGFTPVESLVIVGLGGGPFARVDLPEDAAGLGATMTALAPAAKHWANGVLLVVFSEHDLLSDVTTAFWQRMPDVAVHLAVRTHDGSTFVDGTTVENRTDAVDRAGLRAPLTETREDLARATEAVTDAAEALTLAWSSYDTGNGARAWCFYDRHLALGGDPSSDLATDLHNRLTHAIPPNGFTKE